MRLANKIKNYILNKIFGRIYIYRLNKLSRQKVKDYQSYKSLTADLSDVLHKIEFLEGYKVMARGRDLNGVTESCIFEDYTRDIQIKPGDIVYDLGSCIGDFTILAAHRGAKVFAFEPDKTNFNILVKNIEINGMQNNIIAYNMAVGPKVGEFGFDNNFENTGGYIMSENSTLKVPVTTIDQIMKENGHNHIDLLKIDVEGSEYGIFSNPSSAQLDKIKVIVGEYHLDINKPDYNRRNLKKGLVSHFSNITFYFPYYFKAFR